MQKSHTKQIHREGGVLANQQHEHAVRCLERLHVRGNSVGCVILHSLWRSYGVGLTQKYKLGLRVHIVINYYYNFFYISTHLALHHVPSQSGFPPLSLAPMSHFDTAFFCFFSVYLVRKGIFFFKLPVKYI